ncbi:DUF2124 domain-containing protein [Methanohalophilus mahii]|uniref:DUF2124 domain-containing protein n=1 Tax=Methanohalophilus mahii (strain ATCC 35705 / DSM 5219 / SLP) TaxID=547558 RepID=D5EBU4_METMS|nr:DUF2124 domain-containing protein [Methanohalophilus mahii]ADE36645.1 conserved hypothetical protein [Methanohalophilus mahii DSM 5219]
MEILEKSEGIGALLKNFASLARESQKIIFIGTPGFCTPFAEIAAYSLRKSSKQMGFIGNTDIENAKQLIPTDMGMQLGDTIDYHADTVVLLGGLAMPKIGVEPEELKTTLDSIFEKSQKKLLIGICFQSIFENQGWTDTLDFDYIIDSDMTVSLKKI